jgi:chemotaxis protein CheD
MPGAPTIAALFAQRLVVGVGDLTVSNNPAMTISTYALGSCVGIVAYDAGVRVGGLLHLMLPESTVSPQKAVTQPAMFADTGLPLFFRSLFSLRADRSRVRLYVAGGANVLLTANDSFRIGERNIQATMDFLGRNGFRIVHSDVGGTVNRTVHLEMATGSVKVKTPVGNTSYSLAA